VEGLHFQHIDPHLDSEKLEDLWKSPTAAERIAGLARCHHARGFVGHLHRWQVCTPQRLIEWNGERVFQYEPDQRYRLSSTA